MRLARATLPVPVETAWGRFAVRQPTVAEAITAIEVAVRDGEEARAALRELCSGWLPVRLSSVLCAPYTPPQVARELLLGIVSAGSVTPEEIGEASDEEDEEGSVSSVKWDDIVWEDRLSDYAAAYACRPSEVLQEPWSVFLLMLKRLGRVSARETVREIQGRGLPHIKEDRERERAFRALQRLAGYEAPEPELLTGQAQIEAIENAFGHLRRRGVSMEENPLGGFRMN